MPPAVKAAIQSFPNGSAAAPGGLTPQHLKDLLTGVPNDNLLVAVTDLKLTCCWRAELHHVREERFLVKTF